LGVASRGFGRPGFSLQVLSPYGRCGLSAAIPNAKKIKKYFQNKFGILFYVKLFRPEFYLNQVFISKLIPAQIGAHN